MAQLEAYYESLNIKIAKTRYALQIVILTNNIFEKYENSTNPILLTVNEVVETIISGIDTKEENQTQPNLILTPLAV